MSDLYDVLVIGGGPAGGAAAYFLGEAGQRVLVLEKEMLPRYKTCGGGLSATLLEQFPFSFEPVIQARVTEIAYALGQRWVSVPASGGPLCMVMRADFDAHLLAQARAEVRQGVCVRRVEESEEGIQVHAGDGQVFRGRYLVAADGANSSAARSLGLRQGKTLAAALEVEAPATPEAMRRFASTMVFVFGEIPRGYLWIFPKADHLSVGIGALRPKPGQLQAVLRRVMARFGISLEGLPLHGHPLPIYTRREPIATRRALLVGDAAGLVDPFSGEGIRFALKSGRLAAEAILSGQIDRYAERVYRQIGLEHRLAAALAQLFYRFPRTCFALGVRNPFTTQAFLDLLDDRAGYAQVIARMFGTLPVFFLAESLAALAGLVGGAERKRRLREAFYPAART